MPTFTPYDSWSDIRSAAASLGWLWYHAPLDTAPRPVTVRKLYQNGKIRLDSGEIVFTADPDHLSRFRRLVK